MFCSFYSTTAFTRDGSFPIIARSDMIIAPIATVRVATHVTPSTVVRHTHLPKSPKREKLGGGRPASCRAYWCDWIIPLVISSSKGTLGVLEAAYSRLTYFSIISTFALGTITLRPSSNSTSTTLTGDPVSTI